MSAPCRPEAWTIYRNTIEACLRDGYGPPGYRTPKGIAIAEATKRLKESGLLNTDSLDPLKWWLRRQKARAEAGHQHFLPDWSLYANAPVLQPAPPADPVEDEEGARRLAHEEGFWRRRSKQLAKTLAETEHVLREVSGLMGRTPSPPAWLIPSVDGQRHKAAGLLHLSDLHAGEVVRADEIGGLNEYDPEIFKRRIRRLFSSTIQILPRWSADCDLAGIVVAANGDLISGQIHAELRETNAITSHEQVYLVVDEICAGIGKLADAFGSVFAVFTPGNHGRTTEKTHAKRTSALSYDTMIGEQVRRHFERDKRVSVYVAPGPDAVYPLLGWTIAQSHGDALGSGGGRGFAGAALPIARGTKTLEWQAARVRRHYDIILTAHYHTKSNPSGDAYGNGSVVGYNEYANRIRAGIEPPQQWLLLVHERWLVREACSIKLEDPIHPPLPRIRVPAVMGRPYS